MKFKDRIVDLLESNPNVNCCAEEITARIEDRINELILYFLALKANNEINIECFEAVIDSLNKLRIMFR